MHLVNEDQPDGRSPVDYEEQVVSEAVDMSSERCVNPAYLNKPISYTWRYSGRQTTR